jgi:lipase chaperone LimK
MARTGLVDALFESKLARGIASAGAVALGVLAVVLWQRPGVVREDAPRAPASWNGPAGPGLLVGPVRDLPATGLDALAMHDTKIALDDAGHLVPDAALRSLMDAFLVTSRRSERLAMASQLRALFQAGLRQPAAAEADRLVTAYLAYLGAQEQMLARERFARPDPSGLTDQQLEHLLAWQRERAQLRQRMLGATVARAWFEQEDATCSAAFDDWRKLREPPGAGQEVDSVELMTRRRQGAALEERRNMNAQTCAAQMIDSFAPRG